MILDNSHPTAISQKQHMEKTSAVRQNDAVSMMDDPPVANKHETFIESHLSNSSPLQVNCLKWLYVGMLSCQTV